MTSATVRDLEFGDDLTDLITGLPKPAVFREHLHLALQRARLAARHVGMVVVDIDDFGLIDERWGWGAGDDLLRQVGQRLLSVLRQPDMATRLGGDRFATVCEDLEDPLHVEALVDRIRHTLDQPVRVAEQSAHLTVGQQRLQLSYRLGTAVSDPTMSEDQLVARAEQEMIDRR